MTCGSTATECASCHPGFHKGVGDVCKTCPNWINNCVTCTSSTVCTLCDLNYLPGNLGANCKVCSDHITDCLECNAWNDCKTCDEGTYKTAAKTCSSCTAPCSKCVDNATKCTDCVSPKVLGNANNCDTCANFISDCIECTVYTACTKCADTFYLDNGACVKCNLPC